MAVVDREEIHCIIIKTLNRIEDQSGFYYGELQLSRAIKAALRGDFEELENYLDDE